MASKPKMVRYDFMHGLVCEDHFEHGALQCCPWPSCANGTDGDSILTQFPGTSESRVYRRAVWTDSTGEKPYSWEGDLPLWFSIPRVMWREAMRNYLVERPQPNEPLVIYHYTSPETFLDIVESGELWMSDYSYLNDAAELTVFETPCLCR